MINKNNKKIAIGVGIFLLVASVAVNAFVITSFNKDTPSERQTNYQIQLENVYEKSFFQLVESFNNMEVNLSKLLASNSAVIQQKMLIKIEGQADTAQGDLATLPFSNGSLMKTTKFVNQVSDYSKSLSKKISSGKKIDSADRKNVKALYKVAKNLASEFEKWSYAIGGDIQMIDLLETKQMNVQGLSVKLDQLNENTFDNPKLIYDGPFSDAQKEKEKASGKMLTKEKVAEMLTKQLSSFGVKEMKYIASIENDAKVYVFEMTLTTNEVLQVSATQKDGMLVEMDCAVEETKAVTQEQAIEAAKDFVGKLNFDVKPIWVSRPSGTVTFVNLAPIQNGVVIYPDLVKVSVSEAGVVGMETSAFLVNNKDRKLKVPKIAPMSLKDSVSKELTVKTARWALVPIDKQEILCAEFECEGNENQYFVYIDANSKEEVDILKIVKGTEGYLVI